MTKRQGIAIIGSSGFLGTAMRRMYAGQGQEVLGLDVAPPRDTPSGAAFRACNLAEEVPAIPAGTDCVFYLAQSPFYREFPARAGHLFGVNSLGAVRAAEAAGQAGARFFCYASTGNVYAPSFAPLAEDAPLGRANAYALSKIHAEEALDLFAGGMAVVAVRFFALFGPGQKAMLGANLRRAVEEDRPVTLAPHPHNPDDTGGLRISFTYVDDAAKCLARLAELALDGVRLPPRLNVAAPGAVSISEYAEAVGRELGREPRFEIAAAPRTFDLVADTTLLRQVAGCSFTPLDEAMALTVGQG
jgi:nucleoside-diphosphate-sugar epimerase